MILRVPLVIMALYLFTRPSAKAIGNVAKYILASVAMTFRRKNGGNGVYSVPSNLLVPE
jgi:hypothetical protein